MTRLKKTRINATVYTQLVLVVKRNFVLIELYDQFASFVKTRASSWPVYMSNFKSKLRSAQNP